MSDAETKRKNNAAAQRKYKAAHHEEVLARARAARLADPEKYAKKVKAYQDKNRELLNQKARIYQAAHPEIKKQWAINHPGYYKQKNAEHRNELRSAALAAYGNKCACCGETEPMFLAIDHINGGGNQHRKFMHKRDISIWLRDNNYPPGFQVLCHNCNMAKAYYGICPHQSKKEIAND